MPNYPQSNPNNTNRYSSRRNQTTEIKTQNTNNINNNNTLQNKNKIQIQSDIKKDEIISRDIFNIKDNIYLLNTKKYEEDKKKEIKNRKYITMSHIIGERCKLSLDILRYYFHDYEQSKTSKKKMGLIKSYAVNTYQGIIRNYNEDRVSIIVNMNKPRGYYKRIWPRVSFFGIFDGHGGETCSEYLRDNLHDLLCHNNEFFPENIPSSIKLAFQKAEKNFLEKYAINEKKEMKDKSGSCALILVLVDNKIYIANVGDSRCLLSMNNGKKFIEVTKDHKPNSPEEKKRIESFGGKIYQTETLIKKSSKLEIIGKKLVGPYRVSPGGLSVSRTIGDIEAKLEKYGGNPNVVISEPDIFEYDLDKDDIDFFILGCDGIFDQLTSDEVINCVWMVYNNKDNTLITQCKDIHKQSGIIADLIMKSALARKSFDNVTCLFISFKELGNFITSENNNIEINSDINKIKNEIKNINNKYNNNNNNINRASTSYMNKRSSLNIEIKNKENFNNNEKKENKIDINKKNYRINIIPSGNIYTSRINQINNILPNQETKNDYNNLNTINNTPKIYNNDISNIKNSIRNKYKLMNNEKKNEIKKISSDNVIKPLTTEIKNVNTTNKQHYINNNNININTNIKPINTGTRRRYSYLSNNIINYK